MASSDISKALFSSVKLLVETYGLTGASVAWPNQSFDPQGKSVWFIPELFRTIAGPRTLGDGGLDLETGRLSIRVRVPLGGDGVSTIYLWEDRLKLLYKPGQTFSSNGQELVLTRSGVEGPIIRVDGWLNLTFFVFYRAHIQRGAIS